MAKNFEPQECMIFVQSTKIGTHENKTIHCSSQGSSFSKEGQGHKVNNYGTIRKVLTLGIHMCNMKALSLLV